jgi:LysR family transcriptional regulator, hydrogen peroxide-inducible genes activator
MEMHQIRYFLAVADLLNFTRAAEKCNVAQPSLTKAIKNLEDEFGGLLFHREGRNTHLSELGKLVKPHLESVYQANQAAIAQAKDYKTMAHAKLRLGVMSTIGPTRMIGFLDQIRSRIPALELVVRDAPAMKLVEELEAGELDVAFIALPSYPERCNARPLFSERYTIAFPKGHRFQGMNAVPLQELDGENYMQRVHCEFRYHFEALGKPETWQVKVKYSSEREDWIQAMILAGFGCAVMPEYLPMLPGIGTRLLTGPEVARTVSLVSVAGRRFTPTEEIFIRATQRYPWDNARGEQSSDGSQAG